MITESNSSEPDPMPLGIERVDSISEVAELRAWKQRLTLTLELAKSISAQTTIDSLLNHLVDATQQLIKADRATVFLVDEERGELWSRVASGTKTIRIPIGAGIAGHVATSGEVVSIPEAYQDPRFNQAVDKQTGYRTHSILAAPMRESQGKVLGVFQALNRLEEDGSVRMSGFDSLDAELMQLLAGQASVAVENAFLYDKLRAANEDTIYRLAAAAEFKDKDTSEHLHRMSRYSEILARKLGMDEEWVEMLRLAAPMHDIGKIGVPDAVLNKPGKLDAEEWEEMKKHPIYGGEILKNPSADALILSETIALYHHEWWNGKGYPHGLAGEAIPLEARIVSVADAFDALTSKRVYKPSFTLAKALSILEEEKGTHFDPKIVDAFGEILPQIREILAQYNPECLAST